VAFFTARGFAARFVFDASFFMDANGTARFRGRSTGRPDRAPRPTQPID
jgi:hypothetical protein